MKMTLWSATAMMAAMLTAARRKIRQILETGSPIAAGKFYDFKLSM